MTAKASEYKKLLIITHAQIANIILKKETKLRSYFFPLSIY